MDWNLIGQQLPKKKNTRVQTGFISDRDYYFLKVMAKLKKKSMADDSASLLTAQIRRHQEEWEKLIEFAAAQEGITPEELFVKIAEE